MPNPDMDAAPIAVIDTSKMRGRRRPVGRPKGRQVDPEARAEVRRLLGDSPRRRDLLIEFLHRIQDAHGCIAAPHVVALAEEMRLAMTEVYEIATFYHHFDVVKEGDTTPPRLTVRVCETLSCRMAGSEALQATLANVCGPDVRVIGAPCIGRCERAPAAVVGRNPIDNATVSAVERAIIERRVEPEIAAYIDYAAYRAAGGYRTLGECVEGSRPLEDVLKAMEDSSLRGLGGAGFPVGRKWRIVRGEPAPRLLAVNIDEGEPGTFKDRYYLERDPHRFLEGMLIAAWAVGIDDVYLYLRDEYAGCRAILEREIAALEADPPCPLPRLDLRRGAGAYICGEESAMIESIEGNAGMPRLRPPYVAQVGLFGGRRSSTTWKRCTGSATFSKKAPHGSPATGAMAGKVCARSRCPAVSRNPVCISRPQGSPCAS
jgi:formate dehydrogenase